MKRIRGSRSIQVAVLLVVLGALAAVGVGLFGPRDRLLLDLAHPVTAVRPQAQQTCWQADHQLMIVTTEKGTERPVVQNGKLVLERWKGKAESLDTQTGTRTELEGLTRLFNQIGAYPMIAADGFACPGGAWFLWRSHVQSGEWSDYPAPCVAHLDGTHYRAWSSSSSYEKDLFLDSRHLIQIRFRRDTPPAVVSDLEDRTKQEVYATVDQARSVLAPYVLQHPVSVAVDVTPGSAGRAAVLITTFQEAALDPTPTLQARHDHKKLPANSYEERKILLPQDAELGQAVVSPQQQRILYRLQMTHQPHPLLVWLHRLLPIITAQPMRMDSLWVSRANGQGMREIGHLPDAQERVHDYLEDPEWLPDGKQVSFIYQGAFYVVPAEPE